MKDLLHTGHHSDTPSTRPINIKHHLIICVVSSYCLISSAGLPGSYHVPAAEISDKQEVVGIIDVAVSHE